MKKVTTQTINMNTLVVSVGLSYDDLLSLFQVYEIVDIRETRMRLFGETTRRDLEPQITDHVLDTITTKLQTGNRAVAMFGNMKIKKIIEITNSFRDKGYYVKFISKGQSLMEIKNHYGSSDVIDFHKPVKVINPLPDADFFANVKARGFDGVLVIGDVHGMIDVLREVTTWASSINYFVLFLGDILDYGEHSTEVVQEVYNLVVRGLAELFMGNHERKIYRYLNSKTPEKMTMSESNKVTLNRLNKMSAFDRVIWTNRFNSLINMCRVHRVDGDFAFAHGAIVDDHWKTTDFRIGDRLESITLFGETDGTSVNGMYNRTYNWTDDVPSGKTVVVGHDIRSTDEPYCYTNAQGGNTIFLDTGCGKGGHLSSLGIKLTGDKPEMESLYLH